MSVEYAIIVKNKTRLESLVERFNTKAQAKFYIERLGGDFQDYEKEHDTFEAALDTLQKRLTKIVKYKIVDRAFLPSFMFADNQLIVAIGQDGLVANTAKYSNGVPIVAVNPDKQRFDGVLLPFDVNNFHVAVEHVLNDKYSHKTMCFAEAQLNDGQRLLAFNDLFIGTVSHTSARYKISFQGTKEEHSSSGLIVSTPAGSTGWLSSIFNMAYGITGLFESGLELKQPHLNDGQLLFAVREPFRSVRTQADLTAGVLTNQTKLTIESLMPSRGVIFSDGVEADFLNFNSGVVASIGVAKETAKLVVKS